MSGGHGFSISITTPRLAYHPGETVEGVVRVQSVVPFPAYEIHAVILGAEKAFSGKTMNTVDLRPSAEEFATSPFWKGICTVWKSNSNGTNSAGASATNTYFPTSPATGGDEGLGRPQGVGIVSSAGFLIKTSREKIRPSTPEPAPYGVLPAGSYEWPFRIEIPATMHASVDFGVFSADRGLPEYSLLYRLAAVLHRVPPEQAASEANMIQSKSKSKRSSGQITLKYISSEEIKLWISGTTLEKWNDVLAKQKPVLLRQELKKNLVAEVSLERGAFLMGEKVTIKLVVRNGTKKPINSLKVSLVQQVDTLMPAYKKQIANEKIAKKEFPYRVDPRSVGEFTLEVNLPHRSLLRSSDPKKRLCPSVVGLLGKISHFFKLTLDIPLARDPSLLVPFKLLDSLLVPKRNDADGVHRDEPAPLHSNTL